jgi:uncharacterized protein
VEQKVEAGMVKRLDLGRSVWELTEEHPELVDLLASLGFLGVKSSVIRATVGRKMTIPEGCRRQGKDLAEVLGVLAGHGFTATGGE